MQITDRYVILVGIFGIVVAWGVILAAPLVFVGAAAIGAWLLTVQYRFVTHVRTVAADLTVTQALNRTRLTAEETTLGTIEVTTTEPVPIATRVTPSPPISGTASTTPSELDIGDTRIQQTFEVTWPVAGQYEFSSASVTFRDRYDLFRHTIEKGTTPSVTVEPRAPRAIHVGEGGDRISTGFGEHDTGRIGSGLKPAELRQYTPGDTVQQIDWKATARLAEPYVREFESQTDLETLLLVDHRQAMGDGPRGGTKLIFSRQVALAIVASARALGDPLGCYTIGDRGFTNSFAPNTGANHYQQVAKELRALMPTHSTSADRTDGTVGPARAREIASVLSDTDAFGQQLQPFFAAPETYVQRVAERPLFEAARLATTQNSGTTRTVIITDDADHTTLREAVKVARRGDGQVLVYLTPSALFEDRSVRAIDAVSQRYTQFEQFRRELTSLQRVRAFEIGPRDRLAEIIAAGNRQRQRRPDL